ncbi:MAG TPA: lysoplasmalogenase [Cytophagales bacterium]|nr:lysoplasmalogenase [Cytophagales bacterium]HCR54698.1 lysoplasmalogenase [Cytophagales bacterium]
MKSKALYLFVAVGELTAVALKAEELQWFFKPLLMVILGVYYYQTCGKEKLALSKAALAAIFFSFLGDVSLMFQGKNELFFIAGLGSFLIAHVCYIAAYHQHKAEGNGLYGVQKFRLAMPIVLAGSGLISILYAHLGSLKVPVVLYAIVLIVMVMQSLFRYGFTNSRSFWMVLGGASLFMISDAMIAINKFLFAFEWSGLAIMSTYIVAQFLIIEGLIAHSEK